jgi:aspartate carbamoyltransferase catalytic subunit
MLCRAKQKFIIFEPFFKLVAMNQKSLVSINDYSKEEYLKLIEIAETFEENPTQDILKNKVVATLFFEPSTRTRLSFETAITRLGGDFIGFSDTQTSSISKGESLKDTIKMVNNYADLIVMRHPLEGSVRYASEVASIPVINAGDGANQHPTQTLLDLYSIKKTQGTLEHLNVVMVGDLKYGRTVHSLLMAMSMFNTSFYFVSPAELRLPQIYKTMLKEYQLDYYENTELTEFIPQADIIYMTRIQKERFTDPIDYEKVRNAYVLNNSMLQDSKSNLKILHPLPRVNEIDEDVDENPKAYYFKQAMNGIFIRQAIITRILGLRK